MLIIPIPTPFQWSLLSLQFLGQKWDATKTAAGNRLNSIRAKITSIQNIFNQGSSFCWNRLTPSAQRQIQLVWTKDAGKFVGMGTPYQKNILENVGDWFLYPSIDFPQKFFLYQNIPFGVGIATIGVAFFFLSFFFSPKATIVNTARYFSVASGFLAKMSLIGFLFRSLGRWTNSQLMHQFHHPTAQNPR